MPKTENAHMTLLEVRLVILKDDGTTEEISCPLVQSPSPIAHIAPPTITIERGQIATLTWVSQGATTVLLNGEAVPPSGSKTFSPQETTTYVLTASGGGKTATATSVVTVTVPAPPPTPTAVLSPQVITIERGQAVTLNWSTQHATDVRLNGEVVPASGSRSFQPQDTTTYVLTAGTATASCLVTVTVPVPPPHDVPFSFIGRDPWTRGAWIGKYGQDGLVVPALNDERMVAQLPSYAGVTISPIVYVWGTETTPDTRFPQDHINTTQQRGYNWNVRGDQEMAFTVSVTDGQKHRVALYCISSHGPEPARRAQLVHAIDPATGTLLHSVELKDSEGDFGQGVWLVYEISTAVRFSFVRTGQPAQPCLLQGIFFGGSGVPAPPAPLGPLSASITAPSTVEPGLPFNYSWSTQNALLWKVDGGFVIDDFQAVEPNGTRTTALWADHTYTLDAIHPLTRTVSDSAVVSVVPPPPTGDGFNLIARGQSNMQLEAELGGLEKLRGLMEARLGKKVNLVYGSNHPNGHNTVSSGHGFVREWFPGGNPGPYEQGLLARIADMPEADRLRPTLTWWMHNEYDGTVSSPPISQAEAEAIYRQDMALVRQALGQSARTTPYALTWVPFVPTGPSTEAVKAAQMALAADPSTGAFLTPSIPVEYMSGAMGGTPAHMGKPGVLALADLVVGPLCEALLAIDGTSPPPPPPPPSGTPTRFSFGTLASPLEVGYTKVTEATTYSANTGYGWKSPPEGSVDRAVGTTLQRAMVYGKTPALFAVDIANGTYQVEVMIGDAFAYDQIALDLNGGRVAVVNTAARQWPIHTFTVVVTNGQLTLTISDLGGNPYWILNSLTIIPDGPPPPAPLALTASVSVTPTGLATFTSAPTGGAPPINVTYEYGDGASDSTGQHQYQPGAYTAKVTATDAVGQTSSQLLPVSVSTPPPPPPIPSGGGVIWDIPTRVTVVVGVDVGDHGLHIDHPHPPRFFGPVTLTAIQDGRASDPAIWDKGRVPTEGEIVRAPGKLTLTGAFNGFIYQNGGEVEGIVTDPEQKLTITLPDVPIDTALDPYQWGHGVLVAAGKFTLVGADKLGACKLSSEPLKGATQVQLSLPATGWRAGDMVVLSDSRQLDWASRPDNQAGDHHTECEERVVSAISADKKTVTLDRPLSYAHNGARDETGAVIYWPAILNLTRNVVVRSANKDGTRGHCASHGRVNVRLHHVEFQDNGRSSNAPWDNAKTVTDENGTRVIAGSNQQGRYGPGWHFHHTIGPARSPVEQADPSVSQFEMVNCSAWNRPLANGDNPPRWGLATLHNSHYGLVKGNVCYNTSGAGIACEDGVESYNIIEDNWIVGVAWSESTENSRGTGDVGHSSAGIWMRGANNYVRNNFVSGASRGYIYSPYMTDANVKSRIPKFKGADPAVEGQYDLISIRATPILEFKNEVGGAVMNGAEAWWLGVDGATPMDIPESVMELAAWHVYDKALYNYSTANLTVVPRWQQNFAQIRSGGFGFFSSDYVAHNFKLRGGFVRGFGVGYLVGPIGDQSIEDTYFYNLNDFVVGTIWAAGTPGAGLAPRRLTLRNVTYGELNANLRRIVTDGASRGASDSTNLVVPNSIDVFSYEGDPNVNFRVYYLEQKADAILEQSRMRPDGSFLAVVGCPEAGLTNAQAKAKYNVCFANEIAPETAVTRAGIVGLTA